MRKTLFAKRQPRRDRNVRTPFREKTKEDGTERITGAELWEAVPLLPMSTSRTHGERMSESSIEGSSSSCSKKFFMPGDAFAQLHNLSSHMAFAAASKLWVGLQTRSKPRQIGTYPMTGRNHKLPVANRILKMLSVWFWDQPVV